MINFNSNYKDNVNLNIISFIECKCYWYDNQFTVLCSKFFNNQYLLIFKSNNTSLKIYYFISLTFIEELRNIVKYGITCLRHYFYMKINNDIIIISSLDNSIKLYEIKNNFPCILHIKNAGDNGDVFYYINSVLLLNDNNEDYIVSSNKTDDYLKLFSIDGKLITDKFCFDSKGIYYIISYYSKKLKLNFIIICNNIKRYIKSYLFKNGIQYKYYKNDVFSKNIQFIENNNRELMCFAYHNIIYIYDFHENIIFNKIELDQNIRLHFLLIWDEKNILSFDEDHSIYIINIDEKRIIKKLIGHTDFIYSLFKIKINNNNYLLSQQNNFIIIWK